MSETRGIPDPARVKELSDAVSAAYTRFKAAESELKAAEQELLEEQCRDLPRYAVGDVILVPKKYFGNKKMAEARVIAVNLHYNRGESRDGAPYESKSVSYSVYLRQKDGTFGGSSEGFWHRDIEPLPVHPDAPGEH